MSVLEFCSVRVGHGGHTILRDVSLRVAAGDLVALVGPNGAGKTTLIRLAVGLLRAGEGTVRLEGRDVRQMPGRERARHVAWLPQHDVYAEPVLVRDFVAAARYRVTERWKSSLAHADQALTRLGAGRFADRTIDTLSGGERQRVSFAALLAQEAPLLLLDEPANHLDPAYQAEIYGLIGELWRAGRGILCVTHDINVLAHAVASPSSEPDRARLVGLRGGAIDFDTALAAPDLAERLTGLFGLRFHRIVTEVGTHYIPAPAAAPDAAPQGTPAP